MGSTSNWSICFVHKGQKRGLRCNGRWSAGGWGNLATLPHFDCCLFWFYTNTIFLFFFLARRRSSIVSLNMMVWIERTIYLYNTHTQTNRRGEVRDWRGEGVKVYNTVCSFVWVLPSPLQLQHLLCWGSCWGVFRESIDVCFSVSEWVSVCESVLVCYCFFVFTCMTTTTTRWRAYVWLITIWLKCKLQFLSSSIHLLKLEQRRTLMVCFLFIMRYLFLLFSV